MVADGGRTCRMNGINTTTEQAPASRGCRALSSGPGLRRSGARVLAGGPRAVIAHANPPRAHEVRLPASDRRRDDGAPVPDERDPAPPARVPPRRPPRLARTACGAGEPVDVDSVRVAVPKEVRRPAPRPAKSAQEGRRLRAEHPSSPSAEHEEDDAEKTDRDAECQEPAMTLPLGRPLEAVRRLRSDMAADDEERRQEESREEGARNEDSLKSDDRSRRAECPGDVRDASFVQPLSRVGQLVAVRSTRSTRTHSG